jgi:fatty acid desaturase
VAPASPLAFWLSGGLNLQIEHHLLPTVNHAHLRTLQPLVEAAARRHGLPYCRSDSIPEAFGKLWRHLRVMGRRPGRPSDAESSDGGKSS